MFKKYYEKLFKQIAIDYNCTPEDLKKGEIIITKSEWNDGRRSYSPDMPFLQIEETVEFCTEEVKKIRNGERGIDMLTYAWNRAGV